MRRHHGRPSMRELTRRSPFCATIPRRRGPCESPLKRSARPHRLKWLPGLRVLLEYDRTWLPADLTAGVVVTLILIPPAIPADLAKCRPSWAVAALAAWCSSCCSQVRGTIVGPMPRWRFWSAPRSGRSRETIRGKRLRCRRGWRSVAGILQPAALRLGAIAELFQPGHVGLMNHAAVAIIVSQLGKLCALTPRGRDASAVHRMEFGSAATTDVALAAAIAVWRASVRLSRSRGSGRDLCGGLVPDGHRVLPAWCRVIGVVESSTCLARAAEAFAIRPGPTLRGRWAFLLISRGSADARDGQSPRYDATDRTSLGMANRRRSFKLCRSATRRTLLNPATGGRSQMVSIMRGPSVAFGVPAPWIATMPTVAIAAILISRVSRDRSGRPETAVPAALHAWWRSPHVAGSSSRHAPGILVGVAISLLKVLQNVRPTMRCSAGRHTDLHDLGDRSPSDNPGWRIARSAMFANVRFFIERPSTSSPGVSAVAT